jgi:hypothetical protein
VAILVAAPGLFSLRWLAVDERHGDGGAAGSAWEFAGDRQRDAAPHNDDVM